MTTAANPSNNPYEHLRGIDPRVIDAVEEERVRSGVLFDDDLIAANAQFAIRVLAKAGEKLKDEVPSDKSYLEGFLDAIGASKKISASHAELGGLLLQDAEVVVDQPDTPEKRRFFRRPSMAAPKIALLGFLTLFGSRNATKHHTHEF